MQQQLSTQLLLVKAFCTHTVCACCLLQVCCCWNFGESLHLLPVLASLLWTGLLHCAPSQMHCHYLPTYDDDAIFAAAALLSL
jgi:hypothetical protein